MINPATQPCTRCDCRAFEFRDGLREWVRTAASHDAVSRGMSAAFACRSRSPGHDEATCAFLEVSGTVIDSGFAALARDRGLIVEFAFEGSGRSVAAGRSSATRVQAGSWSTSCGRLRGCPGRRERLRLQIVAVDHEWTMTVCLGCPELSCARGTATTAIMPFMPKSSCSAQMYGYVPDAYGAACAALLCGSVDRSAG
jgi:hypothetical protein